MTKYQTDVAILGGGPSGLMLSRLLFLEGIRSVIIERQPMQHVLERIRAGVLEEGSVNLMQEAELGDRVLREGQRHSGFRITYGDDELRIDIEKLTGKQVTVYGQTEVTKDLFASVSGNGIKILESVTDAKIHNLDSDQIKITGTHGNEKFEIHPTFIAGCDGFRGISRQAIPADKKNEYERVYPFGWLGVLSETKPADHELIYASHEDGFSLCSMRNERLSRYYVQCPAGDSVEQWSDDRFWDTLKRQIPSAIANNLETGPSLEKSIAPLRSFVCEPLSFGRLFIAGDAGHIVPPTGAKGLNLAFSDIYYLSRGFITFFKDKNEQLLKEYSDRALDRIWKSERFSWWMTSLLHRFDNEDGFAERMRRAEFKYLCQSEDYQRVLATNYVGLPY